MSTEQGQTLKSKTVRVKKTGVLTSRRPHKAEDSRSCGIFSVSQSTGDEGLWNDDVLKSVTDSVTSKRPPTFVQGSVVLGHKHALEDSPWKTKLVMDKSEHLLPNGDGSFPKRWLSPFRNHRAVESTGSSCTCAFPAHTLSTRAVPRTRTKNVPDAHPFPGTITSDNWRDNDSTWKGLLRVTSSNPKRRPGTQNDGSLDQAFLRKPAACHTLDVHSWWSSSGGRAELGGDQHHTTGLPPGLDCREGMLIMAIT